MNDEFSVRSVESARILTKELSLNETPYNIKIQKEAAHLLMRRFEFYLPILLLDYTFLRRVNAPIPAAALTTAANANVMPPVCGGFGSYSGICVELPSSSGEGETSTEGVVGIGT